jgi:Lrp/AsnC family transcriptional regulator, leucine-responsive regulatory protein
MHMIGKKDLLIVSNLRKNARETLTNMSKATHIPISTIYDKMRLHEGGLIRKHTCLLDYNKLGYPTRANVLLRVDKEHREALKEYLVKHMNVNSVSKINNNYDFFAEMVFREIRELEDFLESLEDRFKVKSKQVFYVIEDLKREEFLSEPELLGIMGLQDN